MVYKLLRHKKTQSSDLTDSQWMPIQGILQDIHKAKILFAMIKLMLNRIQK